jgi:hypothetical protein
VSQPRSVCLLLALLTGCVAPAPEATTAADHPFALPAGAPRNVRIGFIEAAPVGSRQLPCALIPGTLVREGYILVSRDRELRPTASLVITQIQGRIALVKILRGAPHLKDEVVLPSTDLSREADKLPAFRTDS